MKKIFLLMILSSLCVLSAQEALLSTNENYYDFLALDGYTERPYLNYRTLSDSKWVIQDASGDIWNGNILGSTKKITDSINFRIYGPELFNSFNSEAPYGQNDGALWQGRGLNSSLTAGARLEAYGIELTLKPEVVFSQNLSFKLMPSAYESEYGYIWGYAYNIGVDSPQRFGNSAIYKFSWGDSEIRYTWKSLTAGFGTQLIWLGPGRVNSLLHSNNSSPYPKVDLGLRKTPITIQGFYAGDIEARVWCGYLSESDYFDTDASNNHNMISGVVISFAPSVLPGLTLSASRVYLAKWKKDSLNTIGSLLFLKFNSDGGQDEWDQRPGLSFDYFLPKAGFEVYGELAINDNPGPSLDAYIRNFSHTVVYTGGLRKSVSIDSEKEIRGELSFEWTNLEMSPTYSQLIGSNTFYMHHQITQGYTNEGQWIGSGTGTGGNSQSLNFKIYYPKGLTGINIHRYNPDNDFIMRQTTPAGHGYPEDDLSLHPEYLYNRHFKAFLAFEVESDYYFTTNFLIGAGIGYVIIHDPYYTGDWIVSDKINQARLTLSIKKSF